MSKAVTLNHNVRDSICFASSETKNVAVLKTVDHVEDFADFLTNVVTIVTPYLDLNDCVYAWVFHHRLLSMTFSLNPSNESCLKGVVSAPSYRRLPALQASSQRASIDQACVQFITREVGASGGTSNTLRLSPLRAVSKQLHTVPVSLQSVR